MMTLQTHLLLTAEKDGGRVGGIRRDAVHVLAFKGSHRGQKEENQGQRRKTKTRSINSNLRLWFKCTTGEPYLVATYIYRVFLCMPDLVNAHPWVICTYRSYWLEITVMLSFLLHGWSILLFIPAIQTKDSKQQLINSNISHENVSSLVYFWLVFSQYSILMNLAVHLICCMHAQEAPKILLSQMVSTNVFSSSTKKFKTLKK